MTLSCLYKNVPRQCTSNSASSAVIYDEGICQWSIDHNAKIPVRFCMKAATSLSLTWIYNVNLHIQCVPSGKKEICSAIKRVRDALTITWLTNKTYFTRWAYFYTFKLTIHSQQIACHSKKILLYILLFCFLLGSLSTTKWLKNIVLPLIPTLYKTTCR